MASSKDTFESATFLAGTFASGTFRGVGVDGAPLTPGEYVILEGSDTRHLAAYGADTRHLVVFGDDDRAIGERGN